MLFGPRCRLTADDPRRRVTIHALLAGIGHLSWRGWRRARLEMWEALRLSRELGRRSPRAPDARCMRLPGGSASGDRGADLMERADALAVADDRGAGDRTPGPAVRPPARPRGRRRRRAATARTAHRERAVGWRLDERAAVARLAGGDRGWKRASWDRAERIADEARGRPAPDGRGRVLPGSADRSASNLAAVRGDADAARALVRGDRAEDVQSSPQPVVRTASPLALAMLDLSLGRPRGRARAAGPVVAEPGLGRLLPDPLGDDRRARGGGPRRPRSESTRPGVGSCRSSGGHVDVVRAAALAEALRARALVLSADGDHAAAARAAEEAVADPCPALELPVPGGACLVHPRRGPSAIASEGRLASGLRDAPSKLFTSSVPGSGSSGRRRSWVAWRVGGRQGSPLTDTERRVAELAAAGNTNREIARRALHERAYRRSPPDAHLPDARRAVADRARAGGSRRGTRPEVAQT